MRKVMVSILAVMVFSLLAACSQQNDNGSTTPTPEEKPVFKIGAIPDQDVSELARNFDEISKYLSEQTGLKVEYAPSQDYAALVTAFQRGEVHLAWFGGLTGVQARNLVPEAEAIAQRPSDEQFHSIFIVQKDLNVNKLEDVKGLSFTFGSESSTSGHLMPRFFLMEAGIDPEKDFDGKPNYSGSHDKTYKLVESGAFQVGVLNEKVWHKAETEKLVDLNKVKVFKTTPAYYDYHWTINLVDEQFGEGTKQKVKDALLSMNKENNAAVLDFFQTDKFIETNNENYVAIEQVAKQLNIIK